jgi:flagellar basal-body rod protein FlgF
MNPSMLNAASSLDLIAKMQDAHAENLANAATTGYRKRLSSAEVFANALKQASGLVTPKFIESIDYSQGTLRSTGNSLDAAIEGQGFFAIETARGERYTRAGAFQLDADGFLVTPNGDKVAGESGAIQIDPALGRVLIDAEGNVRQGAEKLGRLKVVEFENPERLYAENGGLFRAPPDANPVDAVDSRVRQEHLE